jgi:uncharacterized protein YukE
VWFESGVRNVSLRLPDVGESAPSQTLINNIANAGESVGSVASNLNALSALLEEITVAVNAASSEIEDADAAGATQAFVRAGIVQRLVLTLQETASRLEVLVGNYSESMRRLAGEIAFSLETATEPERNVTVSELASLAVHINKSTPSFRKFQGATQRVGSTHERLRPVLWRLAHAIDQVITANHEILKLRPLA